MASSWANLIKSSNYRRELHSAPLPNHLSVCRARSLPPFAFKSKKASPLRSLRFSSGFFPDVGQLKLGNVATKVCSYGGACAANCSISVSGETLKWVFTGAAALLMLLKNTSMNKSFLVPLLALQAPREVMTWIRGEYGLWTAFLALLVRLFYYIPGELELPLICALLVITAPYQAMDVRGTTAAMVVCAIAAAFLAYQHFSGAGGVRGSFKDGTLLASLAVACLVAVPIFFLFGGVF